MAESIDPKETMEQGKSPEKKEKIKVKLKEKINRKKENLTSFIKKAYQGELTHNKVIEKAVNFIKIFIVATRKFMVDDCLTKASATAYTIIVSFIPTATVVLTFYSIFAGVEGKKEELFRKIELFMVEHNMKINIDAIFGAISGLVDNAAKIGGIGAVIMVFSATAMLRSLEKSLNDIWNISKMRSIVLRIIFYWAALTLGPAMLIAGTTVATKVTEFFSSSDFYSAYISDAGSLWVVGSKASILNSKDGSLNFQKFNIDTVDFDNQRVYGYEKTEKTFSLKDIRFEPIELKDIKFRDVQFIGNNGWIIGTKGVILNSTDGGLTWTFSKWDSYDLHSIHMVNEKKGFISSTDSTILMTEDGGKTWEAREWEGVTADFNAINFYKNFGIITGTRGTVLITEDGGKTWNARQIDEAKRKDKYVNLNNAFFISAKNIWINGNEGMNLYSGDGGNTWKVKKFKEFDYYASYFFDQKSGFIAGSKGTMIFTEDGGDNWKVQELETYKINKFIQKNKKIWALGDTGLIHFSIDQGKTWKGIEGKSVIAMLINFFAPFVFIWLLFAMMYMAMPNTKVPFKYASLGAAFTGAVWVIFILLFIFYVKAFAKGTFAVYGTLASIPLFLLMIYSSTVIILYGAEVSYTLMHPETYLNLHRTFRDRKDVFVYFGLAILANIYRKFEDGKGASTEKEVLDSSSNSYEDMHFFMNHFIDENLVLKREDGSYIPANSSANIKLAGLIDTINNLTMDIPPSAKATGFKSTVKEIFGNISNCTRKVTGQMTLRDLIENRLCYDQAGNVTRRTQTTIE